MSGHDRSYGNKRREAEPAPVVLPFGISRPQKSSLVQEKSKIVTLQTTVLKSAHQLKQEEAERKKKKADEEAAAMYVQFASSFESSEKDGSGKMFVRGGAILPENQSVVTKATSEAAQLEYYQPTKLKPYTAPPASFASQWEQKEEPTASATEGKKKRAIDSFMMELKQKHEERDKVKAAGGSTYAFDHPGGHSSSDIGDDQKTSNLHVAELDLNVSDAALEADFSKFGPVLSIKCMRPRNEEEQRRGSMSGFIFFALREDASDCLDKMNGAVYMGHTLRMGWAKQPRMPSGSSAIIERARQIRAAKSRGESLPGGLGSSGDHAAAPPEPPARKLPPGGPHIIVAFPEPQERRQLVDRLALMVLKYGQPFEFQLRETQGSHPHLQSIFQAGTPENMYYRWRVYSLLQRDTIQEWHEEPFQMFINGPWWIPPLMPVVTYCLVAEFRYGIADIGCGGQISLLPAAITQMGKPLAPAYRSQLESMLHKLTISKACIRDVMGFTLDHAEAAPDIVEVLTDSLTLSETTVQAKIARLFLVSDILFNSSRVNKPNIHIYRSAFEFTLPMIFKSFNEKMKTITGRITAQNIKEQVLRVLRVWDEWSLYPQPVLDALYAIFTKKEELPPEKKEEPKPCDEDIDGAPLEDPEAVKLVVSAQKPSGAEDIDGEPIEDIDGAPMGEEDIDGMPIEDPSVLAAQSRPTNVVKSKWDADDHAIVPVAPATTAASAPSAPVDARASSPLSRELMRTLEVKVMEFQDSLEGSGLTALQIEHKVNDYRQTLFQRLQPTRSVPQGQESEQLSNSGERKRRRSPSPDGQSYYGQDGYKRRKNE